MIYKNQEVRHVSISYKFNGNKAHVDCIPEFTEKMMKGLERDGAQDVKILHYFNKNGIMIKDKK